MKFRPRTTFENRNRCCIPYQTNSNVFSESKDIYQSPKIQTNKIRTLDNGKKKKLFSLLDIDDKITNCRGTSTNNQYKRLSTNEIDKMFGVTYRVGWNYDKGLLEKFMNRTKTPHQKYNFSNTFMKNENKEKNNNDNNYNEKTLTKNEKNMIPSFSEPCFEIKNDLKQNIKKNTDNIKEKKVRILRNIEVDNNINEGIIFSENNNNCVHTLDTAEKNIKKYNLNDNTKENNVTSKDTNINNYNNTISTAKNVSKELSNNNKTNINSVLNPPRTPLKLKKNRNEKKREIIEAISTPTDRNDRWLPKNYSDYELLVKNPKLLQQKLNQDSFSGKLPYCTLNDIVNKVNNTDIFFINSPSYIEERKNINQKKNASIKYTGSDIFGVKNDLNNLLKCGENYLFKNTPKPKYTSSRESNSKWAPNQNNLPSLFNYQSTGYNITCPDKKANAKTKQIVMEESYNRGEGVNPTHKQKAMSEFIDITKNGSGNPGRDFIKNFKENKLCCFKKSDVCATFGDIHKIYKDLCNKPFIIDKFSNF